MIGAEERTRTSTRLPGLAPEASASANSATPALGEVNYTGSKQSVYATNLIDKTGGQRASAYLRRRFCRGVRVGSNRASSASRIARRGARHLCERRRADPVFQ